MVLRHNYSYNLLQCQDIIILLQCHSVRTCLLRKYFPDLLLSKHVMMRYCGAIKCLQCCLSKPLASKDIEVPVYSVIFAVQIFLNIFPLSEMIQRFQFIMQKMQARICCGNLLFSSSTKMLILSEIYTISKKLKDCPSLSSSLRGKLLKIIYVKHARNKGNLSTLHSSLFSHTLSSFSLFSLP